MERSNKCICNLTDIYETYCSLKNATNSTFRTAGPAIAQDCTLALSHDINTAKNFRSVTLRKT